VTDIRAASIDAIPFGSDFKRRPAGAITKESGGDANGLVRIVSDRRVHGNAYIQERALAIAAACEFFSRGSRDALEVGPMLGTREGNALDERDLQRIRSATPALAARA
jgi:hypothetical protein